MSIGFTMGVWDGMHAGHLRLLKRAATISPRLIVGVVDDEAVRKQKGDDRPIFPYWHRANLVKALGCVADVVRINSFDPYETFRTLSVNVWIRGEDQSHIPTDKIESDFPQIVITTLKRTPGVSTTELLKKMKG